MQLIDTDELLERLEKRWKELTREWGDYDAYANGFCGAMEMVEQAPTVVNRFKRCKDCLHYDGSGHCTNHRCSATFYNAPVDPDFFCGYCV